MNQLAISDTAFKLNTASLEELLIELAKYGNPRVSKTDSGWYSRIEVFVTGTGTEFTVMSEYKHSTPNSAVATCYSRLVKALKELGVTI